MPSYSKDFVVCVASPLVEGGCEGSVCLHRWPHEENQPFCGSKVCNRQHRFQNVWCVSVQAMKNKYKQPGEESEMPYATKKVSLEMPINLEVLSHKCKLCGYNFKYPAVNKDAGCPRCYTKVADVVDVITDINDEADYKTHAQYRWHCKACKSRGVLWAKKNSYITACPKCGEHMNTARKLPPKGECSNLWGDCGGLPTTPVKRYKSVCGNCGLSHFYLLKKPTICSRCGDPLS